MATVTKSAAMQSIEASEKESAANPAYVARAQGDDGKSMQLALWGAIILAVAGLAVMTLRLAKS